MSARRDGWWRDYSCNNDAKSITLGQLPFQLSTTGETGNRTLVSRPPLGQDYGVRTCALIGIVALIGATVLSSLPSRRINSITSRLTSTENPLTARVMVARIWMHLRPHRQADCRDR